MGWGWGWRLGGRGNGKGERGEMGWMRDERVVDYIVQKSTIEHIIA